MLASDTVTLVRIQIYHAEWMYNNLFRNSNIMKLYRDGKGRTKDETLDFVRVRHDRWSKNEPSGWIVHVLDKPAGYIGFGRVDGKSRHVEVGYCFVEEVWGKGVGSKALAMSLVLIMKLSHTFDYICATADPKNVASEKLLLKSGFKFIRREKRYDNCERNYYEICVQKNE